MIKFQTLLYFATLLSLGASYRILEEGNKVIPEMETEEPQHVPIPVFETETNEPEPIPVDTFGEMIQAGKYNNIDFEMMEDLNIEWPVKSPDPEEIRQLKLETQNMLDDRIVNGEHVQITDRPFQVYIGGCGGSLVHPNWILTAAHCIYLENKKNKKTSWNVRAGSRHQGSGGETRYVSENSIKLHPQWTGDMSAGMVDLALMYIDEPFTESSSIQLIQMNEQYPDLKGQIATMSGWGKTEKTDRPDYLSQTSSKIVMDGDDQYGMGVLRMMNTAGSGICQGDSGGPATIKTSEGTTILAGVASYVWEKCGPGINGGFGTYRHDAANYVDINKYMDWIKETIKETPDCEDRLPSDYTCFWTCEQWAANGYCSHDWSNFAAHCGTQTPYGKVEDYCKLSCGKCATDNNALASKMCKARCEHLKNSCGTLINCNRELFDVSKHCPVTCAEGCKSDQFECNNGECIPKFSQHDGYYDCSDGSDEF